MKISNLARPPIQPHETKDVQTSVCANHNGLIRFTGDIEGRVLWCPIGKEFFRFSKNAFGMNTPLPYKHEKPI